MESRGYLCDDLIRDILVRLPTKSLLRFKSISKSWSSSISDPCFRRNSPKVIIINSFNALEDWVSSEIWSPGNLENLHLPAEFDRVWKTKHMDLAPVGSCNGLFLLEDLDGTHLWMLNLSTRECYSIDIIPKVRCPCTQNLKYYSSGFGYNIVDDDYKVIKISTYEENHMLNHVACVYSLRNNAWRAARGIDPCCLLKGEPALVSGKLHYIAYQQCRGFYYILAFDLSSEEFVEVAPLPIAEDANTGIGHLRELGGCLTLTEMNRKSYSVSAIWALKDSGWVELFKTNIHLCLQEPLAYSKTCDEVLMNGFSQCVWYNIGTGEVDRLFHDKFYLHVYICCDTLVSIGACRSHGEGEEDANDYMMIG